MIFYRRPIKKRRKSFSLVADVILRTMNDPWDVKSVRRAGQYVSCMKMNGVPLLPPVLSKECHKEMQYYKLLAKEVEKRISILEPYILDEASDSEDKTDAPELPESEQISDPQNQISAHLNHDTNKVTYNTNYESCSPKNFTANIYNNIVNSNITLESNDLSIRANSPKLVIDFNFSINESSVIKTIDTAYNSPVDLPERDYNCVKKGNNAIEGDKSNLSDFNKSSKHAANYFMGKDQFTDLTITQDGPSSLSSKSFTGSLNDLHITGLRSTDSGPKLIRQRSYTLLKPGPLLQAHLEIQSKSTGLEMNLISMSESVSNLNTPSKKRRSWDLESAKQQWSSMAMELKQRNLIDGTHTKINRKINIKSPPELSPPRSKSVTATRRNNFTPKNSPKSEPVQGNTQRSNPSNVTPKRPVAKEMTPAKNKTPTSSQPNASLVSEADDPAARVRELYEKIQNQQLIQMASLVEKQKKEQLLLQQVFEEQNNLLYKQLKTICPKSPVEVKEAWVDKNEEVERGPVSLKQLINHKSPDSSILDSPVSSTLTDTNNYLSHCDDMLKKSRHITESFKKSAARNGDTAKCSKPNLEGSITRTHSPTQKSTLASRRLNYDTSASLDHDYDQMLTDRTNDTLADLNTTFPSDNSDECNSVFSRANLDMSKKVCGNETKANGRNSEFREMYSRTNSAINQMEDSIKKSMTNSSRRLSKPTVHNPPSERQRAAATKIVAQAKGFLVRRLMKTERVQATVQTIKDALLCALQLHQDREGIRGADVDLHRRLIQQITAACYSLHDTFITSTPTERCAMIATDRHRRNSLAAKQSPRNLRQTDVMSHSFSGSFPARSKRAPASPMTQSNYEMYSGDKAPVSRRHPPSPQRRPWR